MDSLALGRGLALRVGVGEALAGGLAADRVPLVNPTELGFRRPHVLDVIRITVAVIIDGVAGLGGGGVDGGVAVVAVPRIAAVAARDRIAGGVGGSGSVAVPVAVAVGVPGRCIGGVGVGGAVAVVVHIVADLAGGGADGGVGVVAVVAVVHLTLGPPTFAGDGRGTVGVLGELGVNDAAVGVAGVAESRAIVAKAAGGAGVLAGAGDAAVGVAVGVGVPGVGLVDLAVGVVVAAVADLVVEGGRRGGVGALDTDLVVLVDLITPGDEAGQNQENHPELEHGNSCV